MTPPPGHPNDARSVSVLGTSVHVLAAGVDVLAAGVESQGARVDRIAWRPPAAAAATLARLARHAGTIHAANDEAARRLLDARPILTGVGIARAALELERGTLLHAGPPVEWADMAGPMRGAVIGACLYEGWARTPESAEHLVASGGVRFAPCHERGAVGPMAGVVSPSMPVWLVGDATGGGRAYCTLNEGLGKVLRYGAFDAAVLDRLRWLEEALAPLLAEALARLADPLDLRSLIAQALQMGDDGHNRNRAGTSLLFRALAPQLVELGRPAREVADALRFLDANDHFFLNLTMPAAKVAADAAAGVRGSTIVTAMARNGVEFGLRTSGTAGRWFTGPASAVEGLYLPGFGPADAALDIGDSAITETVGIGGFVMAGAPAIVGYVGGTAASALAVTREMAEITWAENPGFPIAALDFAGAPTGIDCRAVCATGILPVINTGIAHRDAGVGQVGAGIARPPIETFADALSALADTLDASA